MRTRAQVSWTKFQSNVNGVDDSPRGTGLELAVYNWILCVFCPPAANQPRRISMEELDSYWTQCE